VHDPNVRKIVATGDDRLPAIFIVAACTVSSGHWDQERQFNKRWR
jgi:hypothetical protein